MRIRFVVALLLGAVGSAGASDWEKQIQQAGNTDNEGERQKALESLVALTGLSEPQRKEATAMANFVRQWNQGSLKFYGSQVKGKGPRAIGSYDFGITNDSPLRPLAELYRGRMLAWTLIENSKPPPRYPIA